MSWWFSVFTQEKPKNLRPLFTRSPGGPPPARMMEIARHVNISKGLQMMVSDAANQAIRHCRIGMVYPKAEKEMER